MAVTNGDKNKALAALTSAAIGLPGLSANAAIPSPQITGNVSYGHYQESDNRMGVDIYHADATIPLSDRLELAFSMDRDTYSGATPAFSMPESMANQPKYYVGGGTDVEYVDVVSAASGGVTASGLTILGGLNYFKSYLDGVTVSQKIIAADSEVQQYKLLTGYNDSKSEIDSVYNASIDSLNAELETDITAIDTEYTALKAPIDQQYNQSQTQIDTTYDADKALLDTTYNQELSNINPDLPLLEETYNALIADVQNEAAQQTSTAENQKNAAIDSLNQQKIQDQNNYINNTLGPEPVAPDNPIQFYNNDSSITINFNNPPAAALYGYANEDPFPSGNCRGASLQNGYYCYSQTGLASANADKNVLIGIVRDLSALGAHLHYGDGKLNYHNDSSGVYIRVQGQNAFSLDSMDFLAPISSSNPGTGPNDYWEILGFDQALVPGLAEGDGTNYAERIAYQTVANGFNSSLQLNDQFKNVEAVWIHYKGYPKTPPLSGPDAKSFSVELDNIVISAPDITPAKTAWNNALNQYQTTYDLTVYNPAKTDITDNYNSQIAAINTQEASELQKLETEYETKKAELSAGYEEELAQLTKDYEAQVAKLDAGKETADTQLQATYNQQVAALNTKADAQKAALESQYNVEVNDVNAQYDNQIKTATDAYNQAVTEQAQLDAERSKQASIAQYAKVLNAMVPSGTPTVQRFQVQPQETRSMPQFTARYYFDNTTLSVNGGLSDEPDFLSNFGSANVSHEFNDKLTTVSAGYGMTSNTITRSGGGHAHGDDHQDHFGATDYPELHEESTFQNFSTGISHVFSKNTVFHFDANYTNQSGYLSNPYKFVYVRGEITPEEYYELATAQEVNWDKITNLEVVGTELFRENRPRQRNLWSFSNRLNQYIPELGAAVHFDYRYYFDDWNIDSHTFELKWYQSLPNGWTVTPGIRYYSQSQADFFAPYFLSPRADGFYSSDFRLSGFGNLGGGVTVSKQFARGITLEAGFEYITHKGSLKLGGGGVGDYADFDYYLAHANLSVDLSARQFASGSDSDDHHHHHHHHGAPVPAGIMYGHMMNQADEIMVGYRYDYEVQSGSMLHGTNPVSDAVLVSNACNGFPNGCIYKPTKMHMQMHMLNLMYAPTDWLNLMIMPQLMSMDMDMSNALRPYGNQDEENEYGGHDGASHTSNGLGDTVIAALVKVMDVDQHHVHVGLAASAPTGSIDIELTPGKLESPTGTEIEPGTAVLQDYGMQLGSGTWDLDPSITYTGQLENWSWGAQLRGTKRLGKNKYGYAYGDIFQASGWGSYQLFTWLNASVRGIYTWQDRIHGQSNQNHEVSATVDYPSNYGGRYWDVGFGLNASIPEGRFSGHNISVEWLQPVSTDYNGYQLDRDGALAVTWSFAF